VSKSLENIIIELIELFRPHLKGIDSVLDIGTGTSIPIHVFADNFPGINYYTVDIVDIRKRTDLPFLIYNGKNLPFENLEFDVVLLNETLHHCEDPETVLTEALRVAKSIYLIEHFPLPDTDVQELIISEVSALGDFGIECEFYNPFTKQSLYQLFNNVGLRVNDIIEIPYNGNRKINKFFFKLGKKL
jgi:ubiquinone/menaquinone biosynthesis C-methylase UbiE